MEHTYLFRSAHWRAEGIYHAANGQTAPLTGETILTRTADVWTLTSYLDVSFPTPVRYENSCRIYTTDNPAQLDWTAHNPALGALHGTFIALPGIITSSYTVPDTPYSGSEMFLQVSTCEYKMQGVFNNDGTPKTWWEGRMICDDPS